MNPDLKTYDTVVRMNNGGNMDLLRSGLGCKAEIIIEQYDEATYVPIQAVIRVGGKPTVYVAKRSRFVPREVEVGLDNNIMIVIKSGLEPGEIISLAPPLDQAAVAENDLEDISNIPPMEESDVPFQTDDKVSPGNELPPDGRFPPQAFDQEASPMGERGQRPDFPQGGGDFSPAGMIKRFDRNNDNKI